MLVLDTEVYSNTGGQASKATPRSAVAKYAAGGKSTRKKDLGRLASDYGEVYVAQIAMGADNPQTVRALVEAEAYSGPSLVIAYSHCIAHGIEMAQGMRQQKLAVDTGYWPLYRYDPRHAGAGEHPLQLDSRAPKTPLAEFTAREARFAILGRSRPAEAERLAALAQHDVDERWHVYEQLARVDHEPATARGLPLSLAAPRGETREETAPSSPSFASSVSSPGRGPKPARQRSLSACCGPKGPS
ncbi:MAG: hypothetical protein FJW96_12045 [Actinobacteria bacterium]|nr:hypothetical protein [Actinomycetota bacterium]